MDPRVKPEDNEGTLFSRPSLVTDATLPPPFTFVILGRSRSEAPSHKPWDPCRDLGAPQRRRPWTALDHGDVAAWILGSSPRMTNAPYFSRPIARDGCHAPPPLPSSS